MNWQWIRILKCSLVKLFGVLKCSLVKLLIFENYLMLKCLTTNTTKWNMIAVGRPCSTMSHPVARPLQKSLWTGTPQRQTSVEIAKDAGVKHTGISR